jgi:hypothetical protein
MNNSQSIQDLKPIENLVYNTSSAFTSTAILASFGATAGLFTAMGMLLFGGFKAIAETKNKTIGYLSERMAEDSLRTKHSIKNLKKISTGINLDNDRSRKIALLIDEIDNRIPLGRSGSLVGDRYKLFKSTDPTTGVNSYKVLNVKTEEVMADFTIDRKGQVKSKPTNIQSDRSHHNLENFVTITAAELDLSLELVELEPVESKDVVAEQATLDLNLIDLQESLGIDRTADDKISQVNNLIEAVGKLRDLQKQSDRISSLIEQQKKANTTAIQRGEFASDLEGFKISLLQDKLEGTTKLITTIETILMEQYQALQASGEASNIKTQPSPQIPLGTVLESDEYAVSGDDFTISDEELNQQNQINTYLTMPPPEIKTEVNTSLEREEAQGAAQ